MAYLTLPRQTDDIYTHLKYSANAVAPLPVISRSLHDYLEDIQPQIRSRRDAWGLVSIYTNPYQFLIQSNPSIVSSQTYYNIVEILGTLCPALPPFAKTTGISANPAAIRRAVTQSTPNRYNYVDTVPENGNYMCMESFAAAVSHSAATLDFIVADDDGGDNDTTLEHTYAARMFGGVAYALALQKRGGVFILKLTHCFNMHTLDILYLLSSMYEKIHIIKPATSPHSTPEKYAVCIGFIPNTTVEMIPYILHCFESVLAKPTTQYIHRFLDIRIPHYVLGKIEEINAVFGQQQLEHIQTTITLIDNKHRDTKIQTLIKQNTYKCEQWMAKYSYGNSITATVHISPVG